MSTITPDEDIRRLASWPVQKKNLKKPFRKSNYATYIKDALGRLHKWSNDPDRTMAGPQATEHLERIKETVRSVFDADLVPPAGSVENIETQLLRLFPQLKDVDKSDTAAYVNAVKKKKPSVPAAAAAAAAAAPAKKGWVQAAAAAAVSSLGFGKAAKDEDEEEEEPEAQVDVDEAQADEAEDEDDEEEEDIMAKATEMLQGRESARIRKLEETTRRALEELGEAKAEVDALRENAQVNQELKEKAALSSDAHRVKLEEATQGLAQAKAALDASRKAEGETRDELRLAKQEAERLAKQVADHEGKIVQLEQDLAASRESLKKVTGGSPATAVLQGRVDQLTTELADARTQLAELKTQLDEAIKTVTELSDVVSPLANMFYAASHSSTVTTDAADIATFKNSHVIFIQHLRQLFEDYKKDHSDPHHLAQVQRMLNLEEQTSFEAIARADAAAASAAASAARSSHVALAWFAIVQAV